MKHIKDILFEMYEEEGWLDKQTDWLNEYKLDPIRLGRMCEKFPALKTSWEQFKTVYELCRGQDDIDRQVP